MSNKIIDVRKVAKLKQLIERQIQLRVEQLATFVQLRKVIDHRMFRGQLLQSDIEDIEKKLKEMPLGPNHDAMVAIQKLLDGTEWNSDTLCKIADVLTGAGYAIRDVRDLPEFPTVAEHRRWEGEGGEA